MKKILVIDDEWKVEQNAFKNSHSFSGAVFHFVGNFYQAQEYLEKLSISEFPDTYIVDVSGSDWAPITAARLTKLLYERGSSPERIFFKSNSYHLVNQAYDEFLEAHPNVACGSLVSEQSAARDTWEINTGQNYTPEPTADVVKKFLDDRYFMGVEEDVYETLRKHLGLLYDADLGSDSIETTNDAPSIDFETGFGGAKTGVVTSSLSGVANLAKDKQAAILVTDEIPEGIMKYSQFLAGIIVSGKDVLVSHMRLMLQAKNISVLASPSALDEKLVLSEGQKVTIDGVSKKLYVTELPLVSFQPSAPQVEKVLTEIVEDMSFTLGYRKQFVPRFTINVSSKADACRIHTPFITGVGLTRTEHFIGPYEDPERWAIYKEFLLGVGPKLRNIFAKATDKARLMPFYAQKEDQYRELCKSLRAMPWIVTTQYDERDTIRLYDIPAEEFLSADDLAKFESLYGENVRGVQLARKVPDLYRAQLAAFKAYDFRDRLPPRILIPAVKTAEDIGFVNDLINELDLRDPPEVGAMIETIEACQNTASIAPLVSFISFGTNDLTAEVHGISRLDNENQHYFVGLTEEMISLIDKTITKARVANPNIQICMCGEAASNLDSLIALHQADIKIDAFSVSPTYRNKFLLPLLYSDYLIQEGNRPEAKPGTKSKLSPTVRG